MQRTWSEGAHDTEIRGGLTAYHPKLYSEATKTDFMFNMKGKKILLLSARVIPEMFQEFQEKSGISKDAVRLYYSSPSKPCPTTCHGQIGRQQRQVPQYCQ